MSVDRLAQLRKNRKKNALDTDDVKITIDDGVSAASVKDVDSQVAQYEPISESIEMIKRVAAELNVLKGRDNKTTDEKERKKVMAEMSKIVSQVMAAAKDVKNNLSELKAENSQFDSQDGNQNSARSQIRHNLYQSHVKRFQESMSLFSTARDDFKNNIQDRMVRQIKIVDTTKSEKEIVTIIESGEAQKIIAKALASDNLRDVVDELRARNQEFLKIQRSVEQLYELFKDLHTLIELQGETINVIDNRITTALDYTQKGEVLLHQAQETQKKARNCKCILLIIVVVILIIVLIPVLITQLGNS